MINNDETLKTHSNFNVPILFVVFNRLDTTKQVFDIIRKVSPKKLYIASDGPRDNREGEKEKIESVRDYALKSIDWDCDVKTLFREKNLGCGQGPAQAIEWFFENEEMGILLEDDVIPGISFFPYCEELLYKYRYDTRISMIGGFNFFDKEKISDTYYYSRYVLTSGAFASWRRAWGDYDFYISKWKLLRQTDFINRVYPTDYQAKHYAAIFDNALAGNANDAWDYQWSFLNLLNDWKCILPCCNLVKNIGFGEDATHTKSSNDALAKMFQALPEGEITLPLKHPLSFNADITRDKAFLDMQVAKPKSILQKLIKKCCKILRK